VQTTLHGLAVAVIVALVTALVGPLFVDWGRWRTSFEAEASRLIGMPVRVSGRIDARLLPSPSLFLNGIEVGPPGGEPRLRARALDVRFALGSLLRGEWRAAQLHLDGPEVTLGVDADGELDLPQAAIGFDPDQLSFDSVAIDDGRAVLTDAGNDTRLVLEKVSFKGEIRSLNGPFKGEGAFVSSGHLYGYRLVGGRRDEDGGQRLRLAIDPADRPLTVETDGALRIDNGRPVYEGKLTLARPAGFALANGKTIASEPWRATGRVKATSAGALFEQIDFQYGPEDRAIKLAGTADLKLGAKPRFDGVLSARQVDLDRALLMPDAARRTPLAFLRSMADTLGEFAHPPVSVTIGVGVDSVTLAGGSLIDLRGDIVANDAGWSLDDVEFRAPGATEVRASGRLDLAPGAAQFAGPASLDSADPKALIAWLEGRSDAAGTAIGSLRARGDLTLGAERVAVDDLDAEVDRKAIAGRLAYVFATDQRPARLDAAVRAGEIDLDGAIAFARSALAGTTLSRPGEIALALDFGRASYAGIDARGATASLRFDANGLVVDRLAIADFGGAVLDASGRIDTSSSSPHGSIALSLEAQRLAGVTALASRFAPRAAGFLQALSQRAASAKLAAKLDVAPASSATDAKTDAKTEAKTAAKLTLDGIVAGVRVNVAAEGNGSIASPAVADMHIDGRLDADDGAALASLIGLDRLATLEKRPARLALTASGRPDGDLRLDAKFGGAGLDATARGTVRLADARPRGALDVTLAAADARLPRRDPAAAVPVALATHLAFDGDKLTLDGIDGKIAGAGVKGRLAVGLGEPRHVEGQIAADAMDADALIATAIGAPASRAGGWSPEPFVAGPLAGADGQIDFTAARATLAPGVAARDLRGSLRIAPSLVALDRIEASLGDGHLAGQAEFRATPAGQSMQAHLSLRNADIAALIPPAALAAGRVSLQVDAGGTGLSPAALVGGLHGGGTVTGENLQFASLDPNAIGAATRAADRGVLIDSVRIGDVVRSALDGGRLTIPSLDGAVAIADGRASFGPLAGPAQDADVSIAGSYGLADDGLDLRVDLTGAPAADTPDIKRPQLSVALNGPLEQPRRTVDVTALVSWLTLRNVEREAIRLEAAEREAKRIQAEEEARRKAQEDEARRRAQEDEARRKAQEAARRAQEAEMPTSGIGAPPLPPPIEIKPVPGTSEPAPRRAPPRTERLPTPPPLVITRPDPR